MRVMAVQTFPWDVYGIVDDFDPSDLGRARCPCHF
jgi:hypothetical protein